MTSPLILGLSPVDLASFALLVLGTAFCFIGGLGMIRLPDFYSRIHAASMTDSLGAFLILLGLMLQAGISIVFVKLLMVLAFLWLTSPAASHALAKAAYSGGLSVRPAAEGDRDDAAV